ncbi:hypothetical protein [Hyphomicrobium sp. CS1BSMeth3]|uniref:hypothetical protein n=1 Tax=Hyphomicrobium sp. CS1BSMeth3 TaxID=1892844 RepID=UPI000930C5FB|nr:hypothetical protein [Hyphomicrobium sp. CS1BSMeth3]
MKKEDLEHIVVEALNEAGGSASLVEVAKYIWRTREQELRESGDLFYTWQYDMRWAAQRLRDRGVLQSASPAERNWALA